MSNIPSPYLPLKARDALPQQQPKMLLQMSWVF
jgi:hypothetical protein